MKVLNHIVYLLLFVILLPVFSTAQEKIYLDENKEKTTKKHATYYRIIDSAADLYSIKDYHKSGVIQFEGFATTDSGPFTLHGIARWYREEGTLWKECEYDNGEYSGIFTEYFPSGEIASQVPYENNKINGTSKQYSSPGVLAYMFSYVDGVVEGPYEAYENGNLTNKGNTKDGYQHGDCYEYYGKGGSLRNFYQMREGKLNGIYMEFNSEGDTTSIGEFSNGVPLKFEGISVTDINFSKFKILMELVGGVEHLNIYRDGNLILESFYKNGKMTGIWKVYTHDGKELYETRDYSDSNCADRYSHEEKIEFTPLMMLQGRFDYMFWPIEENDCENVVINKLIDSENLDPYYHINAPEKQEVEEDNNENKIDYKDPSKSTEFQTKNSCTESYNGNSEISMCKKSLNGIEYIVYLSEKLMLLEELKEKIEPTEREVHFFFQQLEEKVYDLSVEDTPDRQMSFLISPQIKADLEAKRISKYTVLSTIESKFWNTGDFSGTAAGMALDAYMEQK